MPREEQIAGLRTILAGGSDRSGGGAADDPLVCLLHGFGASGADLAGLWRVLDVPQKVRFAFPEAPQSLAHLFGVPAFAWWLLDLERLGMGLGTKMTKDQLEDMMNEEPEGLPAVRERVLDWLAELTRRLGVPVSRVVLGGFSQGAMLAADVALHLTEGPAGLCLLSGALINRKGWSELLPAAPIAPRFQSHGSEDAVLPFSLGEALHDFLKERYPGTLHRFRGGHEIPAGVIEGLGRSLTGWLDGGVPG